MSTENNFETELAKVKAQQNELVTNINKIKRVLSANEYKLRVSKDEEIALYKKYGVKVPREVSHPELVKLHQTAMANKDIFSEKYKLVFQTFSGGKTDLDFYKVKFKEYVDACKEKGVQIKSSEEIANILQSVKNFKEELKEVSLYDILNKVSKEAEEKKAVIKKSLKEYDFASKIDLIVQKFFPAKTEGYTAEEKERYVLFFQWAQIMEDQLDEKEYDALYGLYLGHLNENNPETSDKLIFKLKNGEFARAIEKYLSIQANTPEYDEHMGV